MISNVRYTILSAPSKSRGVLAVVRAHEYCTQGGDAHIKSKVPGSMSLQASQSNMFAHQVGLHFGSMSRDCAKKPSASRERSIDFVPQKRTSAVFIFITRTIFFMRGCSRSLLLRRGSCDQGIRIRHWSSERPAEFDSFVFGQL